MGATKVLDMKKDVNALCNEYPELVDVMVGLGFKPLANPMMRKMMGSHMTIPDAAKMRDIPIENILFALAGKGFSVLEGSLPSDSQEEVPAGDPHEPGHTFLARMGKTRLRPGGKDATEWLLANGSITSESKVLEVACNMCTTLIQVVEKYGCEATGLDLDEKALEHAAENLKKHGLEGKIALVQGSAFSLPFPDNTFDVVINEAMLTMLTGGKKDEALSEYYRVLKPGGKLLTQDVLMNTDDAGEQKDIMAGISRAINVQVEPLTLASWTEKFEEHHFRTEVKTGKMTLLDPEGMIHDEGEEGTRRIMMNAMQSGNADFFERMFNFFNTHKDQLGFIAVVSTK